MNHAAELALMAADEELSTPYREAAAWALERLAEPPAVAVKPLVWDIDGRKLHMDQTMAFSKSYDWGGWDCFRQEGYGLGASYIIWPDSILSEKWNLYGTSDGLFIPDLDGVEAAKAAAQSDYAARIFAAIDARPASAVRDEALEEAAALVKTTMLDGECDDDDAYCSGFMNGAKHQSRSDAAAIRALKGGAK